MVIDDSKACFGLVLRKDEESWFKEDGGEAFPQTAPLIRRDQNESSWPSEEDNNDDCRREGGCTCKAL